MTDAITAVLDAVTEVAPEVRDGLTGRREYGTDENPSGEQMLAADMHADELIEEKLLDIDAVGSYGSEERDSVSEADDGGRLHVACDPLDGSSNLVSNNVLGTVVAVYDEPLPAPGSAVQASAYVQYGPITTMVIARDGETTEYVIDADGDRRAVEDPVELPEEPTIYGFGGRVPDWPDDVEAFVRELEAEYKLRYSGAMAGDVSQVLEYGGVFAYPKLESNPDGKLRLQFEGIPVGHIIECAGGRSSDGTQSLLDVEPTRLHQRAPVYVGNTDLIDRLEAALDD